MTSLDDFIRHGLEVSGKATRGPLYEREDHDYYQGGTYLGVEGYRYGRRADGTHGEVAVDCSKERAEYFRHNVCRIEGTDADKEMIRHAFENYPKALRVIREVMAFLDDDSFPNETTRREIRVAVRGMFERGEFDAEGR